MAITFFKITYQLHQPPGSKSFSILSPFQFHQRCKSITLRSWSSTHHKRILRYQRKKDASKTVVGSILSKPAAKEAPVVPRAKKDWCRISKGTLPGTILGNVHRQILLLSASRLRPRFRHFAKSLLRCSRTWPSSIHQLLLITKQQLRLMIYSSRSCKETCRWRAIQTSFNISQVCHTCRDKRRSTC